MNYKIEINAGTASASFSSGKKGKKLTVQLLVPPLYLVTNKYFKCKRTRLFDLE